jgi:hypothetical protein
MIRNFTSTIAHKRVSEAVSLCRQTRKVSRSIEYDILPGEPKLSARINGRSDWRTMIGGTDRLVIAHEKIATRIPTAYYVFLAILLVGLALVKATYRLRQQ